MPDGFASAQIADGAPVLNHIGDDIDLRERRQERPAIGVRPRWVEFAEDARKAQQRRIIQFLIARQQHEMVIQCPTQGLGIGRTDGTRGIKATQFRPKRRIESNDLQGLAPSPAQKNCRGTPAC